MIRCPRPLSGRLLGGATLLALALIPARGIGSSAPSAVDTLRPALPVVVPDPAVRALAALGWSPDDLRFDRQDMDLYGGGPYRLPIFEAWIDRPFLIPGDVRLFQNLLLEGVGTPSNLMMFAGLRTGRGVRRGLIRNPADDLAERLSPGDPWPSVVDAIWEAGGGSQGSSETAEGAVAALSRLPGEWTRPVALILTAAAEAARWRRSALAPLSIPKEMRARPELFPQRDTTEEEWLHEAAIRYVAGLDSDDEDPAVLRAVEEAAASVDLALLQAGAADLLLVLERSMQDLAPDGQALPPPPALRVQTPLGIIAVGSPEDDTHEPGDYLLLLDPAGNDRYAGGGASGPGCPISMIVDLSGNDLYEAGDSLTPAFGAGVLGVGLLVDRSGDDRYRGIHLSLGAGFCGLGLLWDAAGNDQYDAFTTSCGAGLFGIGVLADESGDDRYHGYLQVQGYGYTLGCGLLVDALGNDEYIAEDDDIRFPSSQAKDHNSSLAQGFGFGKRADFVDGHSLAGGLGILADGAGDDRYRCGVFGQGSGYWYGTGVLADRAGNDRYEGIWYVQGAAAHFAIGALCEGGGDDSYRATRNMAQGAGHDFSLGLLYDESGSDEHQAPNLSLGGGNANGMGIYWDVAGNDRYSVTAATTLGRSNVASRGGLRDRMKNLGLFLDTGGIDEYPPELDFAGNNRIWIQSGTNTDEPLPTEAGVGLDTEWTPGQP